ncbi:MAG: DNA-binding domain-containing protein [Microcystis panniformis]
MGKPQIAVRIPPPLLAELNQYVERVGTSKTDVIISAIAAYLDCAETVPLSQRVAELETKVKELQVLLKARFIGGANE